MKQLQKFYPHFLAIIGFILISLLYFYPVLQGKKIFQSDIVQYTGMAKEQNDFRAEYHTEPYWTNSAFGGMPTYQLGANYPHDYIGKLDDVLRFLPRPADYLFLYFLGFYGLLLVIKIDPLKAFFGALAFGFSTYLIVILGVGHNAKAHAIGYMPLVVAGFILVFKKRYLLGGILTMLAVALEINANHFQMTYYLLLLLVVMGIYFLYKIIQEKDLKSLPKIAGTFAVAIILALGANATSLLATKEYTDSSIRGKSELTFNADGSKDNTTASMSTDYITEYSYGIAESLDLIAPRLFGGSNAENVGKDSKLYEFIINQGGSEEEAKQFAETAPTYWGDQPIVAAPAYIGAIVFFLCVLALYHDKRKIKYAFVAGASLSLLLSWGKNFSGLTNFFIEYVPLYDKFRAVSSTQVVLELCIPVLAIMGLQSFFKETENQKKALLYTAATSIGLIVLLFLAKSMFSFSTENDGYYIQSYGKEMGTAFVEALKADRANLFLADLLRSAFFMIVAFGSLWFYLKGKLAQNTAIILIGVFMVGDLFFVDKNYVSNTPKQFASAHEVDEPFQASPTDEEILKDKSIYRVYEIQGRLQGRTSYFHKSVGGYSAVRPRRYDQVFDYVIDKQLADLGKNIDPKTLSLTKSIPMLNALNVKYLVVQVKENQSVPITNPFINGNAWFVSNIKTVNSADEEMKSLDKLNTNTEAVFSVDPLIKVAPVSNFIKDSLATIKVNVYKPNHIEYTSNNSNDGFAVFSETYYKNGWKATIDGKEAPIYRVDYVLRGLQIPKGKHTIEFNFEPQVIKTGSSIALFSSVAMLFVIIGGVYLEERSKRQENKLKLEPKKLLIITYYWPPAGGPGVQRWLKFVKYLPDFNVQPVVYIPENPTYPIIDNGLTSEVSEKAIILKHKIFEPYQLASFFSKNKTKKISSGIIPNQKKQSLLEKTLLWVRGNIFIPDARFLWVKPSVNYLEKYIQENNIDTIVTSGPPHSLHLIGLALKKQTNIKWLADFRDPWTTIGYHKALKLSSYAERKHKALEKEVLNSADTIIVTSKTTKTEFESITSKPIVVITNGYDVEKIAKQALDDKFTLAHIGSFLSERNPKILWQALQELITENNDFKSNFQLKLIGATSQEVLDAISEFKLNNYIINLGYVSHQEAVEHQRKSQVLLLIEINSEDTKSIIPGKLFEYMISERPIIAIGPKDSDFAEIITKTNTGVFFTYNEKAKLKALLLKYFQDYQNQNLKVNAVGLQQYSRKSLTEQLAKLITHNS